ncbi:MAG: DUF1016 N-terminal domain-containing protein [Candidatus Caenarcaniphilales bacterium]|nr:DUF1016 N-terminal domain-containing protein [Candidatus Caenarcaniphilales bacterium]
MGNAIDLDYKNCVKTIKSMVASAQYEALRKVNKELIELYWNIGKAISVKQEELGWGKSVVEKLARDLQAELPGVKGFSSQNLWYMRQFYIEYQGNLKLQPLVGEISWTKNVLKACRFASSDFCPFCPDAVPNALRD